MTPANGAEEADPVDGIALIEIPLWIDRPTWRALLMLRLVPNGVRFKTVPNAVWFWYLGHLQ